MEIPKNEGQQSFILQHVRFVIPTSWYYLWNNTNYGLIIVLFTISWITDAMDGAMARKFNMKSKFGEVPIMMGKVKAVNPGNIEKEVT